jgi:hypothetical protein
MIEKHKRQLEDIANRNLVGIPPGAVRHLASEVSTIARILLELAPQLEWPIEPDGGPAPIPPPQEYDGPIEAGMVFQLATSNFEPTCLVRISSVDDWTVYMRVLSGKVRENGPGSTAFMGMNEFRRRAAYISRAPVRRPKLFAPPSTASSNSPKAKVSAPIPLASAVSAPEAA